MLAASASANALNPANNAIGIPPYASIDGDQEVVSLSAGTLHVTIPAFSLPQLGGRKLAFNYIYDSKMWSINLSQLITNDQRQYSVAYESECTAVSGCSADMPLHIAIPTLEASIQFYGIGILGNATGGGRVDSYTYWPQYCVGGWIYTDWQGNRHAFPNRRDCPFLGQSTTSGNKIFDNAGSFEASNWHESRDGSYSSLDSSNAADLIVTEKDGTKYHFTGYQPPLSSPGSEQRRYFQAQFSSMVDVNGNTVILSQGVLTDTMGRTLSIGGGGISYRDSAGTSRAIATTTSNSGDSIQYNFPLTQGATSQYGCGFVNQPPTRSDLPFGRSQSGPAVVTYTLYAGPQYMTGPSTYTETVNFPGGRSYSLTFDTEGQLTKIVYPGGGYSTYDYSSDVAAVVFGVVKCSVEWHQVQARHVCSSSSGNCSSNQTATTTYTAMRRSDVNSEMDVLTPMKDMTVHKFTIYTSVPVETDTIAYSGLSVPIESTHTDYTEPAPPGTSYNGISALVPQNVMTSYYGASGTVIATKKVSYTYDVANLYKTYTCDYYTPNGQCPAVAGSFIDNVSQIQETDFSANVVRTTNYTWEKGGLFDGATAHILNHLSTSTTTDNVSGSSRTTNYTPDSVGNNTAIDVSGSGVAAMTTHYTYTPTGEVMKITDPSLYITKYDYGNPWSDTQCAQSAVSSGRPASVTNAASQTAKMLYYSCSGLLAQITDPNGAITKYTYDPLGRVSVQTNADFGTISNAYQDAAPIQLQTTQTTGTGNPITRTTFFDGLSRKYRSQLTSDKQGTVFVFVDTQYDLVGRVYTVSNPYFKTTDSTYALTTLKYDPLSRNVAQINPGSGTRQWCYNGLATSGQTNCLSNATSATAGLLWADSSDESNIRHQQTFDAQGNLQAVLEPDPSTGTLALETDYTYNNFGDLTGVAQKGKAESVRSRAFSYDSLSRLITSSNPETGTICYGVWSGSNCVNGYDADGNLVSKTDARGVVTSYAYDALNRVKSKTYVVVNTTAAATLSSCYQYDTGSVSGNSGNFIGRLTNEWTQAGACPASVPATGIKTRRSILSYDPMGRVKSEQQCHLATCTTGTPYKVTSDYDLAGNLTFYTNNIQSIGLSNYYDAAGRLGHVDSSLFDAQHPSTLVSIGSYTPAGAVQHMTFGTGIQVTKTYDNRLRVTGETVTHP